MKLGISRLGANLRRETQSPLGRQSPLVRFFVKYKYLHLLILPGLIYFIIFKYLPMYGVIIAFQNYKAVGGFRGTFTSEWVGLLQFKRFFQSVYFTRLTVNTILISLYRIILGFPAPIILALLFNELRLRRFKRVVQTVTYMPHFLSWVVIAGFVITILSPTSGPINAVLEKLGFEPIFFLSNKRLFRGILVLSDMWRNVGWQSIIYLAAISGINPELYEAATVDGALKWQKIRHITLPGIKEIIAILLILRVGRILDENFQQILNLYNPAVYEVADVYETYVYRIGILQAEFSFAAAVGFFKSICALVLIYLSNKAAKKLGTQGLW